MSLSRSHLKRLRSLHSLKDRREQDAFLLEGEKLVREALLAAAPVRELLATPDRVDALQAVADEIPVLQISSTDATRIADARTPQGVFAVVGGHVPEAEPALRDLPAAGPLTVVVLDGVQDPGNAGALIRVAAAFEADLVLVGPGSADPTNPKVLRAATGAWFHVPLARSADLPAALDALRAANCALLGAAGGGRPLHDADVPARRALVFGGEGGGFSPAVADRLELLVGVPIAAEVESLNVAVAAGILLSELHRRDR
ncbi:MAG: RNA methyltransferase [Dehalococcoidia bacterium]